jgi:hypothetical protein
MLSSELVSSTCLSSAIEFKPSNRPIAQEDFPKELEIKDTAASGESHHRERSGKLL